MNGKLKRLLQIELFLTSCIKILAYFIKIVYIMYVLILGCEKLQLHLGLSELY